MIHSYLKHKTKKIKYTPPNVEDIINSNKTRMMQNNLSITSPCETSLSDNL